MQLKNQSIAKWAIFLSVILLTWITANLNWGKENWKEIVRTDGKGYYAYLPAIFIYDDLNFGFYDHIENEKYFNPKTGYDYRSNSEGKTISKYYCGTAVAQLPFFLMAHSFVKLTDGDADGYSKPYMVAVSLATIFYLFLGLWFLNKTLILYEIKDVYRAIAIIAAVFGTNLFFYSVSEPSISHVYSFGFIALFVFFSKKFFLENKALCILVLGLILGMIVLIRPVNILILLAWPFLAGDWKILIQSLKFAFQKYGYLILSISGFALMVSIQLIIYKVSTGSYMVYSYGEEGFNWSDPHIFDILFSYKKGLFLYTPIYLISMTGLIFLWKKRKYELTMWLLFFIIITYVFSSWHMWWYGGSFSGRIYVEFIPLFMIIMAIALQNFENKVQRGVFIGLVTVLILICQIQIFQYRYYKIHWDSMTKEMYWKEFLRVDHIKN
ncbi:MAG: hypothetical protein KDC84_10795 [Crocinitomicaceae bacterium]|nr:hypothetical protein [Crocinitomicaceae bacterium]